VGPAALKIGAGTNGGLTKKIYLAAGNYEFRYWYKSTVVYPTYEPLYICGSDVREWDWVTATNWRSNLAGTTSGTAALSTVGGVFLEPVTVNPQTANTPPSSFDSGNFLDGCAYSARWIERTASFKVNNAGYYWLSIVSQAPGTANGFYLGQTRLCASACAGDPNNNSPWKTQPVTLATDSFETPQADNTAFSLTTPFGYTHPLYKTPIANWNFRKVTTTTSVEAVTGRIVTSLTLTPPTTISPTNPQIVIRTRASIPLPATPTAPAWNYSLRPNDLIPGETNSVQFSGAYTSLTRSLLLLPGVYKLTFPITSQPQAPSYACQPGDYNPSIYPTYFRTDYPSSPSYGGSPPPFARNDPVFAEREFMQNFYYFRCNSTGSFLVPEVAGGYNAICFLVLRAHSYDVGFMAFANPGMRLDDVKLELLTSKFLDPSAATSTDPRSTVDLATKNSCDETGVYTTNKIHIQYAYVTGYPQYTTYSRGGGRFTVTHSKYP
jgi:hypothetical protein